MASGSFYNYPVSSFGLYCTWESTPDNANNQSTVTLKTYLSYYTLNAISQTATTSINGVSKSFTAPAINVSSASSWTKKLLNTRTETIKHNSDGTKQITLQASYPFNGKYSGTSIGTITASKTVALDNIKTACTAPTSFTVTSDNVDANGYNEDFETKLTLKWSGAKAGIGNTITDYQISYATNSDNSTWNWVNLQKVTSTSTSGSLTVDMSSKVSRGNYVRFRIQVLGSAGSSYYSSVATASYTNTSGGTSYSVKRNPYTACTAPTSVTASSNNFENTVTISWSGASGGASNSISSYYIQYATSPNNTTWGSWTNLTTVSSTATSGSQSIDMSSKVSRGHYVKFRVRTQGSAGGSYYSDYTSSSAIRRQDYTNCVAPTSFTIVSDVVDNPFETSVTLKWSGASGGTANTISSYYIQYAVSSDNSTWNTWSDLTIINSTVASGDATFNMSSNVPRSYYVKFRIQVRGSAGSSYYSDYKETYGYQRNPYTACTAPTSFTIVSDLSGDSKYDTLFENKLTLKWSGASSGTNNSISGYNIYCAIRQSIGENIDWNYQLLTDIITTNNADSINLNMLQLSKSIIAILDDGSTKSLTEVPRTYYVRFRIETKGNAGSSYYSEKKTASYSQSDGSTAYSIRRNPYTKCSPPTEITLSSEVALDGNTYSDVFENQLYINFSGAKAGENNNMMGLIIQYRLSNNQISWNEWKTHGTFYDRVMSGSGVYGFYADDNTMNRGQYVQFRMATMGSQSGYDSDYAISPIIRRNSKPPNVTEANVSALEYSYGDRITLTWQPSSDIDNNIYRYKISSYYTTEETGDSVFKKSGVSQINEYKNCSTTMRTNSASFRQVANNQRTKFVINAIDVFGVESDETEFPLITRYDETGVAIGIDGKWVDCQIYVGANDKWVEQSVGAGVNNAWLQCGLE